jgi:hypothetical protein
MDNGGGPAGVATTNGLENLTGQVVTYRRILDIILSCKILS